MDPDETKPFSVGASGESHAVLDAKGEVVLTCGDEGSAAHYAAMLNDAYGRGYRDGYRAGKGA
ncbi:MAG: hypothetical protein ACYTDY_15670 [Planctomycetota bacterium]|jgi:hypothetical protein